MRFILNLSAGERNNTLPINYQYELSSWIYYTLNSGNPEFADFLHKKGYLNQKMQFKLFCFSNLIIPKYKVEKDRIILQSDQLKLITSFYPIEAIETFILGIFKNQEFSVGDKKSRALLRVKSIEKQPEPDFNEEMSFKTLSPVHVVRTNPFDNEKKDHLSPEHKDFELYLFENLVNKYNAYHPAKVFEREYFKLSILSEPRSKVIQIKTGTRQQTRLKSYLFDFKIKTYTELMRMGYYAGFGKENSQGFGCAEILNAK